MAWREDRQERTESATPRRREDVRKKGQVAKSREVASVAVLITSLAIFYFFGLRMMESLKEIMKEFIAGSFSLTLAGQEYLLLKKALVSFFSLVAPLIILPLAAVGANLLQVGLLFTVEPLTPNLARINPIEGFKRLIAPATAAELVKSILKFLIVGYAAYVVLRDEIINLSSLSDMDMLPLISHLGSVSFRLLLTTAVVLMALAVMDYVFQRWEFEKNIRMTRYETKEEFKETEGHPLIKSRIRSLQKEMARRRMMKDVEKATVVLTNPTHLSVAIKYEQGRMRAPLVVAKGAGLIAEKIREVARKHGVPIVENKPLAQAIYQAVAIGKEIPSSLYKAVAEVLAYIYRLKGQVARGK